jgi:hypothetical protein
MLRMTKVHFHVFGITLLLECFVFTDTKLQHFVFSIENENGDNKQRAADFETTMEYAGKQY